MLSQPQDPIVAIATAPGRGAIGVVRVSGRNLMSFVRVVCGKLLRPREATYLPFRALDGAIIDRGLAIYFVAPHSFTGEDVLELHVHGGPVVLQMLVKRCLQAAQEIEKKTCLACLPGVRIARPGEFTERAFLNGKIDLAQAEAIADLIDASTEAAALGASRSLAGDFSREIRALLQGLIRLRTLVEATLDFPEEEIDFLTSMDARGQLITLLNKLSDAQRHAKQGTLLREGIRVVIAGQPNAGKSSLLNALAGAELAIVTAVEGTTRDKIQQTIQIAGVPVHVIDTAGLREGQSEVEKIGIELTWTAIKDADVVLFLHDLTRHELIEYQRAEAEIAANLRNIAHKDTPVLDVWNKVDAATTNTNQQGIHLSAKTGEGLETLRAKLLELAGWRSSVDGLYIARERHLQALSKARLKLEAATEKLTIKNPALDLMAEELRQAQNALSEITGEFTNDDLLGEIFSSFCIGK